METTEKETRKKLRLLHNHVFSKQRKSYSLQSVENVINEYVNNGGEYTTLKEGCLGLGLAMLHGLDGFKIIIIEEFSINSWNCGHHVTKYNEMPKKYLKMLEEAKSITDED